MSLYISPTWSRRALSVGAATLLFAGGVALSYAYDIQLTLAPSARRSDLNSVYVPKYERAAGPQLVMVYLGSSTCRWSNQAPLPDAVEKIKLRLARYAEERGMSFRAVGVAFDWSPELGLEHLAQFGLFDEVSAGYNWGNALGLRYFWSDEPIRPATPQILVYERIFIAPQDSGDVLWYGEKDRRNLVSEAGVTAITNWAQSGIAIPAGR